MPSSGPLIPKCQNCNRTVVAGTDFCALCLLTPVMNGSTSGFSQSSSLMGQRINGYRIEDLIGAGGFADVYSARRVSEATSDSLPDQAASSQTLRQKSFAVKVLRRGISSPDTIARFEVERRLLEQFTHESIVRVFESGLTDDARPYFVMEQIDGLPITEFCRVERLSLHQRLELFSRVCDAVYHAHSKGIIHRDLKPSNVLVHIDEGVVLPKVIDFGIAKAIETPDSGTAPVTQVNMVIGTPAYISPEQAEGSDNADTRSDIYSLGVLLYEVVTDHPAWSQDQWRKLPSIQWSRFLRENRPPAPSQILRQDPIAADLAKQVRGDIDQIIRKAMSANPSDRYASAFELAADIRRWLAGRPVVARPLSPVEQLKRYVNSHRWQAGTLLVSLTGIVAIGVLGTILSFTMRQSNQVLQVERNKAVESERLERIARAEATAEKTLAEHQRYASEIRLSEVYLQNNEPHLAAERLRQTQPSLREWEFSYLSSLSKRYQSACDYDITDASLFGSDKHGNWIVVASKSRWQVANIAVNQRFTVADEPGSIEKVAIHSLPDRIYVAILGNYSGKAAVRVYSYENTADSRSDAQALFLWETAVSLDGSWIQWHEARAEVFLTTVFGNGPEPSPGKFQVFEAATGKLRKEFAFDRLKTAGKGIECSPDFPWILVRRSYDSFVVLTWPDLALVETVDLKTRLMISDFLIDAPASRILFSHVNQVVQLQRNSQGDISEPKLVSPSTLPEMIHRLNLAPNRDHASDQPVTKASQWIAISDQSLVAEGEAAPQPLMTKKEISQSSLKDGSYVALLAGGRVERRSDRASAILLDKPTLNDDAKSKLVIYGAEGRRICVAPDSSYCLLQPWDRGSFVRVSLGGRSEPPEMMLFEATRQPELEWTLLPVAHPDGSVLTCVDGRLKTLRFDVPFDSDKRLRNIADLAAVDWDVDAHSVWSAAFSADGSRVFLGTKHGVSCFDWKSHALIHHWPVDGGPFHVMASTDDDTCFALRGDHTLIRIGRNPSQDVIFKNAPGPNPAIAAFCQATQQLAISVTDGVSLFQLSASEEPELICRFACPEGVTAIAMDEQGRRIAIASSGRRIVVWDVLYQLELVTVPTRVNCSSLAFSRDGRFLVGTDFDPSINVFGR